MKTRPMLERRTGIFLRTALLSWLVTIATLLIFVLVILPEQKRAYLENLHSKARGIAVGLRDLDAASVVNKDFSTVVDHCLHILSGDKSIDHLVLTRNDGFSIILDQKTWYRETNTAPELRPPSAEPVSGITQAPPFGRRVFHYAHPFDYTGISWGWIHVGLSLEGYDRSVATINRRTLLLAALCIVISLAASITYARRLVGPLLRLRALVQKVADGDLAARAAIESTDEVGDLAQSFNQMTAAVQERDTRLREQNLSLARMATDKALLSGDIRVASRFLTELSSQTINASRCGVWLFDEHDQDLENVDTYDRRTGQHLVGQRLPLAQFPHHLAALNQRRTIAAHDARQDSRTAELSQSYLVPQGISSLLAAPIRRGTRIVGTLFHEHCELPREWTLDEQNYVGSVADLVALALEARDRQQAEDALRFHNRVLQGARLAALRFLAAEDWHTIIHQVLHALGTAADSRTVQVFVNQETETPESWVARQQSAWSADGPATEAPDSEAPLLDWGAAGPAHWAPRLRAGHAVTGRTSETPPEARIYLEAHGAQALILVPVNAGGRWWGFLALSDARANRDWSLAEADSLQAAADSLGHAIERQQSRRALIAAKDAAEAASEAKSQFLANMSHEIRTPITGVMGTLQLLKRTTLDNRQGRYVTNALTSAETLLTVLGDVLDFSKIEAGRLELEDAPFNLPDTIDAAVRLFAEKAEMKGLELTCRIADDVPVELVGDANRLRQILLNLIGNAIKFTDQGEIMVDCTSQSLGPDADLLRFAVRDSGCGIASHHQSLIFDAFYQADNSMGRAYGGTGLGLAISRQLCELMGGTIGVQSQPGHGSTFWFTARLRRPPAESAPPVRMIDLHRLHVLVIDDSPVAREIVCGSIQAWKGRPEEASNAAEGLVLLQAAAAKGDPFAVAVLDWQMPGEDGMTLARRIKSTDGIANTRLVLLSSFSQPGGDREVHAAGFVASLAKPARRSDLYNALIVAANGQIRPPNRPALRLPSPTPSPGRGRLLLAEDNEINQEVACELLVSMGYECRCVRSGQEALEAVHAGGFDLVLMDCQMPGMDGYEAARQIRGWERERLRPPHPAHLPIVALTAHAMKGDRDRCLDAGMDDYLTKPLDPNAIAATLSRWLPRSASPSSPPTPAPFSPPPTLPPTTGASNAPTVAPSTAKEITMSPPSTPTSAMTLEAAPPPTSLPSAPLPTPAPIPPSSGEPIDYAGLLHRCMGRRVLADRLIVKFHKQAHEDLDHLKAAITAGDGPSIQRAAHRLKGAAANVAAPGVLAVATRLEALGREGQIAEAAVQWEALQRETHRLPASPNP